jgi:hypothetical protein
MNRHPERSEGSARYCLYSINSNLFTFFSSILFWEQKSIQKTLCRKKCCTRATFFCSMVLATLVCFLGVAGIGVLV